jgi:hypothetical protein
MGAEIPYQVVVLKTVEEVVEVSAVTNDEATEKANKMPGVIRVLGAYRAMTEDELTAGLDDIIGRSA